MPHVLSFRVFEASLKSICLSLREKQGLKLFYFVCP